MENIKIDRINELANKSKISELTEQEKQEQQILRREYIESVKASLVSQLNNTYIVDKNGNKQKLNIKQ